MAESFDEYGAAAEYYDYVPTYAERDDVRFFVDMARESGGPVLELGLRHGQGAAAGCAGGHRDHGARPVPGHARHPAAAPGRGTAGGAGAGAARGGRHARFRPGQAVRAGHDPVQALPAPCNRRRGDGLPGGDSPPPAARRPGGAGPVQSLDEGPDRRFTVRRAAAGGGSGASRRQALLPHLARPWIGTTSRRCNKSRCTIT